MAAALARVCDLDALDAALTTEARAGRPGNSAFSALDAVSRERERRSLASSNPDAERIILETPIRDLTDARVAELRGGPDGAERFGTLEAERDALQARLDAIYGATAGRGAGRGFVVPEERDEIRRIDAELADNQAARDQLLWL